MSFGSLAVVEEWLEAANHGDGFRLEQLTHEEIEILGPRGHGRTDRRILSEWLTRAGFSAVPLRWFCGADGTVVVEQDARWVDVATGVEQGRARVASQFLVEEARVAKYVRHDKGLGPALAASGLRDTDEVIERETP
ncbi:MAG: hypothetical protein L0I76_27215 [Pseudonocardia sp.]|nr:hypothetical protein [Pseudonocardia sp.]